MQESMLNTKIEKIQNYLNILSSSINQLKAASFVENEKMHLFAIKQSEILLNEIDKEISNMKRINIADEMTEKETTARLTAILEEARRLAEKKMPLF